MGLREAWGQPGVQAGMAACQGCNTQLREGWAAPNTVPATGTRLGTEDNMPNMTLDCMWELQPHDSSSEQATQLHTYKPEIEVPSQTSPWQCRVNALPWGALSPGFTTWQEVTRRYEEMSSLQFSTPFPPSL